MGLQRRSAWAGASHPEAGASTPSGGVYRRVTVHHDGTHPFTSLQRGDVVRELRRIFVAHQQRRYFDIGYHFAVDRAGGLWEGRPLRYQGAHVRAENPKNIGILLLGNFERQRPAAAQWQALWELTAVLCGHYGIRARQVLGHRDLAQTHCPGRYAYPLLSELRQGLHGNA